MIDIVKLKLYMDYIYTQVYSEGDAQMHANLTKQVVQDFIDPLNLSKDSKILDLGCGPGYFLDLMTERGYTDVTGVSLSEEDLELCRSKGHAVMRSDLSFLNFKDESIDFIFLRHALEHSVFPYISLLEYNRILKPKKKIYIEVPAPDCLRSHETNINHYSIMGPKMLCALLLRAGFEIDYVRDLNISLTNSDTGEKIPETYYILVATKKFSMDIK